MQVRQWPRGRGSLLPAARFPGGGAANGYFSCGLRGRSTPSPRC